LQSMQNVYTPVETLLGTVANTVYVMCETTRQYIENEDRSATVTTLRKMLTTLELFIELAEVLRQK